MTRTQKTWVVVAIIFMLWMSMVFISRPAASAATTKGPYEVHTWTARGFEVCKEYPNGTLAGWSVWHTQKAWGTGETQYRYGKWDGRFCSNNVRIWNVNWGGQPDGWANWALLWKWHPKDTKLVDSDNTGSYRYRKWRSHFSTTLPIVVRHDYPWLRVSIGTGASITFTHGCGCS